jgi:ParB-like chromosome segregation protein Spo0J
MARKLRVEEWELDRIKVYENNAKLHPDWQVEQIANSIEEFGMLDPIAVDENGEILEGHGRLLAAQRRGDKTIPVIQVIGLSDAQKVAYRLFHNKSTQSTEFDLDLLQLDIEFLKEENFDLELTGFDADDLVFDGGDDEEENNQEEIPESSAKEVDVDALEFEHKCPKCGFEFDSKK